MTLDDVQKGFDDASEGFKKMQTLLMVYCGLVTLAIILITVKLLNEEN